jgi:MFS family permease
VTTLAQSSDRSRLRVPEVMRGVVFRRYWSAHTASLLGDQITLLALPLVAVLSLDASAAEMGYLTALALLPNLLFALHAGAWVDRFGRRRLVMIACDLGRAMLLASIPVSHALGTLSFAQLAAVAFGLGTFSVVFGVANASLFVSIVPHDRYVEASSLMNGSRALSFVAGPSAAGLLVRVLSAPAALIADALSFLASALLLGTIAPTEAPPDTDGDGVLAGLRWVARSSVVRSCLLASATVNFFNFIFWALFVLYATRSLGIEPGLLGLVLGAGALGGIIGSVLTTPISRRIGVGPTLALGLVVFPAPLLLVPLATGAGPGDLVLLFLAEFGSGFGVMLLDISAGSLFAAVIPHRLRSRVSGAYTFANYGVRVLGSLAGGVLGTTIGLRPTLWIATTGALLGVLWLLPSPVLGMRELPPQAQS